MSNHIARMDQADNLRNRPHQHHLPDGTIEEGPPRSDSVEQARNLRNRRHPHHVDEKSDEEYALEIRQTNFPTNGPLVPVPITTKSQLGSPTALAIGAFATTLTTLSLSLMGWRGVSVTNVFIGNFFFVAGIGMVISAQWELVLGNSYAYTVLSAFGLFYAGFGAIITPSFGVEASYNGDTASYNNALGFWVLMWAVWNVFFLIGSLPLNIVYIGIFFTVQMAFTLVAASYFAAADGHPSGSEALKKAGGVFAFLSGLLGYYTVGNLMCQDALQFSFPMGDTSHYFIKQEDRD